MRLGGWAPRFPLASQNPERHAGWPFFCDQMTFNRSDLILSFGVISSTKRRVSDERFSTRVANLITAHPTIVNYDSRGISD